jgi:hypothetical protein
VNIGGQYRQLCDQRRFVHRLSTDAEWASTELGSRVRSRATASQQSKGLHSEPPPSLRRSWRPVVLRKCAARSVSGGAALRTAAVSSPILAACCPTEVCSSISFGLQRPMLTVSSRARSQPTCRCRCCPRRTRSVSIFRPSLRVGFLTSAAKCGASIFKMMDVSRHRSVDTLRGYVRDAELFQDHAGTGLL